MIDMVRVNKRRFGFSAVLVFIAGGGVYASSSNNLTTQAFVNAPVISIRAPIPGRTSLGADVAVGNKVKLGQEIAVIEADTENPRVSVLRGQLLTLENQRGTLKSELSKIAQEIIHREAEYTLLQSEVVTQTSADIEGAKVSVTMAASNLDSVKLYEQEALRNLEQARELREGNFISSVRFEQLEDEYGRAQARATSAQEQLKRARIALAASQKGVQIDGARSLPYVVTRSRALEESISDLKARSIYIHEQIELITTEVGELESELNKQSMARLESPIDGVIWDIISNDGDGVTQQAPVVKVVNCKSPWVEAFLDESDAANLSVGESVTVQDYFNEQKWNGSVISIRYGTGRVTVGQYMVEPPPEVMRRQLPVRVATVKIGVNWGEQLAHNKTCHVGSSVKVYRSWSL